MATEKDTPRRLKPQDAERRDNPPAVSPEARPVPGFEEDWQFREYEKTGVGFKSLSEVIDVEPMDSSGSLSPNDGGADLDEGRSRVGEHAKDETDPADAIETFAPTDLRYGGEDISGVSEWSMRAHNLELDDGLSAADYDRPDEEILEEVIEACERVSGRALVVECSVEGGVVRLRGRVENVTQRERIENAANNVPGVKELESYLEY